MSLKNKVMSSLRWTLFAKFGTQLVSWSCTFMVMRFLDPDDYGLFAMAAVFVTFGQMLNEMGLGQAIVQAPQITIRELRQCFGLVVLSNGTIFLVLCAGTPLIARFFDEPRLYGLVPVLASQFLVLTFFVIPNSLMEREMQFRFKSINEIFATLTGSGLTLLLAWSGGGVWSLVLGNMCTLVIRTVSLNLLRPFFSFPCFDFRGFRSLARFGAFTVLNRSLWYLYSQTDILIVGKFLGKSDLGQYSVASQLSTLPLQKVAGSINQVGMAAMSRTQNDLAVARYYLKRTVGMMAAASFPVFFGFGVVAPVLIPILLGDKWAGTIVPVQLLSILGPLQAVNLLFMVTASATGRPEQQTKSLIVACLLLPPAYGFGAWYNGILGVCLARLLIFPFWFLFSTRVVAKSIGMRESDVLMPLVRPLAASLLMVLAAWAVQSGVVPISRILALILAVLVGAAVYLGLLRFAFRPLWDDLKTVVRF